MVLTKKLELGQSARLLPKANVLWRKLTRKSTRIAQWLVNDPAFLAMAQLARFISIREWVASQPRAVLSAETVTARAPMPTSAIRLADDLGKVSHSLRRTGYYEGLQLDPHILAELVEFAQQTPCYANRDPQRPFLIHEIETFRQHYASPLLLAGYQDEQESCPAFQALKHDPTVLDIASQYLGCPAVYLRSEITWAFPAPHSLADKVKTARVLHCDINDYKTVKFFFYLNPVSRANGPHVYLQGTHRDRTLFHQCIGQGISAIADDVLIESYGRDRLRSVTGDAGYGFVGDPYCLHKGTVPRSGTRLLLQLEFGRQAYNAWYF